MCQGELNIKAGAGSTFVNTLGQYNPHAIDAGDGDDYVALTPFGRPHAPALFVPQTNGICRIAPSARQAHRTCAA